MTAIQLLCLASIAGAALFFVAGAASAALRDRSAPRPELQAAFDDRATQVAEATHGKLRVEHDRLQRELTTARTTIEQLQARVRDVEREAELRAINFDAREAELRAIKLDAREAELRTIKLDPRGSQRRRPSRGSRPPTQPKHSIGEALAAVIETFSDAGTRSVAIADALGFPLASSGDDGQALAAYGALLFESANRANQFLPVAAPVALELVDERGARVSVWTFEVDADRLVLVNLAVAPADPARVEAALADLSVILAPTGAATGS